MIQWLARLWHRPPTREELTAMLDQAEAERREDFRAEIRDTLEWLAQVRKEKH